MIDLKTNSNCLIIAHLSNKAKKSQRWGFNIVEWLGIITAKIILTNNYNKILVCRKKEAAILEIKRKIAQLPQHETLDIILNVHGLKNGIFLFENEFIL